jgi:hypothetical protein
MSRDVAAGIAPDRLAMAGERDWLDAVPGFLEHLAFDRVMQAFAGLHAPAGKRVEPFGWGLCPPHDQDTIVADNSGADRENGTLRIGAAFIHGVTFLHQV